MRFIMNSLGAFTLAIAMNAGSAVAIQAVAQSPVTQPPVAQPTVTLPAEGFLSLEQLKQRYGDASSRYMTIGGMSIRYKDEGRGPAIVLLHGSHSSLDGYDDLARGLADEYRVIRFDMPGMGLSSAVSQDEATTTPYGDDILRELLDGLGVKSATLVGVSSGGAIAYYFASLYPDRVDALVLTNVPSEPVIAANTPRTPELRQEFEIAEKTGFRRKSYWSVYLNWLTGTPSRMTDAKISRYYDMNRRQPLAKPRWFWRTTAKVPEIYTVMSSVKAPALLVWGKIDFVLPLHTMSTLQHHLPASSVSTIVLEDTGHYPPFEVPERFARIVKTYLTSVVSDQVTPEK
ncbi:MAG TPA: alpha/beta hydrolase [Pedomonas sp.]|uniref:alpha/beta fold hydrolase n=1 Tax=Pedomonas sp. TaxID=2976421 RepID=UPI002F408DD4